VSDVNRDDYLRLLAEGFELAFEKGELEAAAARYSAALSSLAPGELAFSDHHGEFAALLQKLDQVEPSLAERRRAVEAARREAEGQPDPVGVALARYFLGEQLLGLGRPRETLEAIAPSVTTKTQFAGPLLAIQAEALAAVDRIAEAKQSARQAEACATEAQRPAIRERLAPLLESRRTRGRRTRG
jgi:tetratricopeptide (TPR) repeat protein